uniref:15-hydroxyprostaglandin dehydrogenase [NAD(+)] n=1 Tax=Oryzias latipes TaxID=8090 RepID=A0A3P9K1R8_ORYLA
MSLDGKVAVVTGAAKGIGKAIAENFLQNGAKVVLLDVDETTAKGLKKVLDQKFGEEKTLFIRCNVESEEDIKAAFEATMATFGCMDILCNNAGILSEDQWERAVSVNLGGVIRMTYAALEKMSQQSGGRGGVVVNTASVGGLGPLPSCPVYSATKHGVIGFTRAMAAASTASNYGIRFNAICPGAVQTDLFASVTNCLGPFSHLAHLFEKFAADGVLHLEGSAFYTKSSGKRGRFTHGKTCIIFLPGGRQTWLGVFWSW